MFTLAFDQVGGAGTVGVAYSSLGFIVTIGGVPTYTFAITSGSLPPGLSLNASTGAVTGIPITPGTYSFTGTATDSLSNTASCPTIILIGVITLAPPSSSGTLGSPYSSGLVVTAAGTPAYTYAIASLPPGLSLNTATGAVTGTPTTGGSTTYYTSCQVEDSLGNYGFAVWTFAPVWGGSSCPANPTYGQPYSGAVAPGPGGTPPYTFYLVSGSFPGGLALNNSTGIISGEALATGTFAYEIEIQDSAGNLAFVNCSFPVALGLFGPFPFGWVGFDYALGFPIDDPNDPATVPRIVGGGGTPPYTYSAVLPAGLSINASTGLITGTPTTAGTFAYSVTVTDSLGATAMISGSFLIGSNIAVPSGKPRALNIFSGERLWQSYRGAPSTWSIENLDYDNYSKPIQQFSAGAIAPALGPYMGIVVQIAGSTLNFLQNGPPFTPVTIPVPAGYSSVRILGTQWDRTGGAFYFGGAYWLFTVGVAGGTRKLICQNSTDGGNTWSDSLDDADAPASAGRSPTVLGTFQGLRWDGVSNLVDVFYNNEIYQFDMSGAGAWNPPSAAFSNGVSKWTTVHVNGAVNRWANGDEGVIYTRLGDGVIYLLLAGGTWGSEIMIASSATAQFANVIVDPVAEILHVLVYSNGILNGATQAVTYYQVTHAGVVTGPLFTFPSPTVSPVEPGFYSDGVGLGALSDDGALLVPLDDAGDNSNAIWECPAAGPYTFVKTLLPKAASESAEAVIDNSVESCSMIFYGGVLAVPAFLVPGRSHGPTYIKSHTHPANE